MTLSEHMATKPRRLFTVEYECGTERTFCPETFAFEPKLLETFGHLPVINPDAGDPHEAIIQP